MNPGDIGQTNIEVPEEIMKAAAKIQLWAAKNNVKFWQIGAVCSRSYALAIANYVPDLLRVDTSRITDKEAIQSHNSARIALMTLVPRDETGNPKRN